MALSRQKKEKILADLVAKMRDARGIVFARYSGVSVNNMNALRGKLRENNIEYKVSKKTLIRKAADQIGLKDIPKDILEGPIGVGMGMQDEVLAAKLLNDFAKQVNGIELMGGVLEGKFLDKKSVMNLANLPAKEILLAKLLGSMKAPVSGFYTVLYGVMRNFVGVLDAHRKKLEGK